MAMTSTAQVRWADKAFHLNPNKPRWPQLAGIAAQMFGIFGGLMLALFAMLRYPMLLTGAGYAITDLGPIALGFVASLFFIHDGWFPPGTGAFFKLQARLGIGLCAGAWLYGVVGIANGYATPVVVRDAPIVYKRTSSQADPNQRSYYIGARVWPSSRKVYEVTVPRDLYARLDVPGAGWHVPQRDLDATPDRGVLRLTVGRGRFGIDWLNGIADALPAGH